MTDRTYREQYTGIGRAFAQLGDTFFPAGDDFIDGQPPSVETVCFHFMAIGNDLPRFVQDIYVCRAESDEDMPYRFHSFVCLLQPPVHFEKGGRSVGMGKTGVVGETVPCTVLLEQLIRCHRLSLCDAVDRVGNGVGVVERAEWIEVDVEFLFLQFPSDIFGKARA